MTHLDRPPGKTQIDGLIREANGLALSVKTVLHCEGRILLLREPTGRWELPGGRVEPGEDMVACLLREVREETGLEVAPGGLVDYWVRLKSDGSRRLVATLFSRAEALTDPATVRLSAEHAAFAWMRPGEAPPQPMLDGYRKTLALCARLFGEEGAP